MSWLSTPQARNSLSVAAGTIGFVLWSIRLLSQIIKNFQRRDVLETKHGRCLAGGCWLLWGFFSQVPAGINSVTLGMPALLICISHANIAFVIILFWQTLFSHQFFFTRKLATTLATFVLALVICLSEWAVAARIDEGLCRNVPDGRCQVLFGRMTIIFMPLFWVPMFVETWRHQGRAVSVGALSLYFGTFAGFELMFTMSLKWPYDILASIPYLMTIIFESTLLLSHTIWRFRTRHVRREAKAMGLTFDELLAQYAKHEVSFRWAPSRKWTMEQDETGGSNATGSSVAVGNAVANRTVTTRSTVPRSAASRNRSAQRATVRHVEYAYGRDSV